ncbi:Uncharacterised protein [Vibrio cholerae]|uniref:Uncharacterized protein n=1 Tax=Vibrio cholerae TaxID=666 RepID=A0A655ZTK1_VIBCL|nr:Uncharacterised protein [Vibrio cholerae]
MFGNPYTERNKEQCSEDNYPLSKTQHRGQPLIAKPCTQHHEKQR